MRRSPFAAVALALLVTGCGAAAKPHGGPPDPSAAPAATQLAPPRATCGTTRTAANVPIIVEVEKGSAPCRVAMQVQSGYTALVRSGRVRGNGGGAPVQVDGWTCQGQDTPTTVQTGEASNCRKGPAEIVAVLNLQSTAANSGTAG
jgi:hypothetical protein